MTGTLHAHTAHAYASGRHRARKGNRSPRTQAAQAHARCKLAHGLQTQWMRCRCTGSAWVVRLGLGLWGCGAQVVQQPGEVIAPRPSWLLLSTALTTSLQVQALASRGRKRTGFWAIGQTCALPREHGSRAQLSW